MPLKKTAFKPKAGKVWKRISAVSKAPHRLAKRFVPAASLKAVKERSGGICEVLNVHDHRNNLNYKAKNKTWDFYGVHSQRCPKDALRQPHHLLKRSRGGSHDPLNLLAVCFECHNWIEGNEAEAVKRGLSIPYKGYTP